jgi:CBS domain-containing protein
MDVMLPVPVLRPEDGADLLIRKFEDPRIRAVAVVTEVGELAGVLTDEDVLRALLPAYVRDDQALARVLEESELDRLLERLRGTRVKDCLDATRRERPVVSGNDTLIEVAAAIVRSGEPAVLVVSEGQVAGIVTVDVVITALVRGTPP